MNHLLKFVARKQMQSCIIIFCLIATLGCGDADYPMITYPPDSPRFETPDVRIEIPPISLIERLPVSIPEIKIPKPSAEIVVHGTLSHDLDDDDLFHISLAAMFLGADDHSISVGLCFPERNTEGKLTYEIHCLGPDQVGPYDFVLRRLTSPSTENFELLRVRSFVAAGNDR